MWPTNPLPHPLNQIPPPPPLHHHHPVTNPPRPRRGPVAALSPPFRSPAAAPLPPARRGTRFLTSPPPLPFLGLLFARVGHFFFPCYVFFGFFFFWFVFMSSLSSFPCMFFIPCMFFVVFLFIPCMCPSFYSCLQCNILHNYQELHSVFHFLLSIMINDSYFLFNYFGDTIHTICSRLW